MTQLLLLLVILAAATLLARRTARHLDVGPVATLLGSRWAPVAFGAATAVVVWWVWGSLSQVPVYHDEAAYVLQARLFASGRWAGPAHRLPEFFEQSAVLVTPVLAPKMPPGHAILMIPGIWFGLPGLAQVLLGGVTGGLLFALARRVSTPWVAFAAWAIWVTAPGVLRWHAAYFSEATTCALWLAGWWALLEWRATARGCWLVLLSGAVAWGAITRPLTMLAYALPLGVVVLVMVVRRRAWRDLLIACGIGACVLGIIPLWSKGTTGDWRTTPLSLYSQMYMPWDVPGFGADPTPPLRQLPPDLEEVHGAFKQMHARYGLRSLPRALSRRLTFITRDIFPGWRRVLLVMAGLGLLALTAESALALSTAAVLVLAYLSYAHESSWTIYYLEAQPVLAFLAALGVWMLITRLELLLNSADEAAGVPAPVGSAAPMAVSLALIAALAFVRDDLRGARSRRERETAYHRAFNAIISNIPASKSIVFVRYAPDHIGHFSLVTNSVDLERERTWIVYDRGAENRRLMESAPERTPYLFDEARMAIFALPALPISLQQ